MIYLYGDQCRHIYHDLCVTCMEGEDPNQQLMHIRQDDKWNIGTYVNWLEQIHADDDDDVENKNPIYYALKTIDDEKLKYCYHAL